jgi:1-deoxy-D-xylulose-5-phosphate synthase
VGDDGATHNGVFDLSYLRSLPNMVVMAPKDENELARMLTTSIAHKGPIAVRYPRGDVEGVKIEKRDIPLTIGKGEILYKGNDLLILAIGRCVSEALTARLTLAEEGISATVVNCRFVKPLDADLIAALAGEIPRIITVEENVRQGGFGSAVLECLSDQGITGFRIQCIGIPDTFVEHGPQKLLRSKYKIDAPAILNTAKKILS